jgi:predicted TIM-barrel fold metal-dependent hydrolase
MSHGGYPFVNEAIYACMRNANVYMDLSEYELAPMAEAYVQALNTIIGDKVVFASAHPFVEQEEAIRIYKNLPLKDDVRRKVMYDNARRILGLIPGQPGETPKPATVPPGFPLPYLPFIPITR